MTGVLIFEGMKVGLLDDLIISFDDFGQSSSKIILSTSYNILPIWLKIAHENITLSKEASEEVSSKWCNDTEKQKELLLTELTPSIQVFVACGAALDAIYDQLKPYANISQSDIESWKKKKTARSAQITEIIRRVYRLDNKMSVAFRKNIKSIMEFRDKVIHPSHEIQRACTRPDIPVGVDWRFAAYRFDNSAICYQRTMEMFIHIYEKGAKDAKVDENMKNIFKALREMKLITKIPNK